jgi:glycerol-3-phosphate O-acyltransferase / dihydroxyacetone phosphate acyltransferase
MKMFLPYLFVQFRDTLYVARMARDLLWEDQESLDRDEHVNISSNVSLIHVGGTAPIDLFDRLVDLFSTPDAAPNVPALRRSLPKYYSLLQSAQLTNSILSSLPLPRT